MCSTTGGPYQGAYRSLTRSFALNRAALPMARRSTPTTRKRIGATSAARTPNERPSIVHSSLYLPEPVYEALRKIAFEERLKIHDVVLEGSIWRSGGVDIRRSKSLKAGKKAVGPVTPGLFDHLVSSREHAGGTERPSASAVLRLITRSNFSGRCIGKSLGLAPCRIFAT